MKRKSSFAGRSSRRAFVQTMLAASAAPWIVPAHVLGGEGKATPANKTTLGVIGVGSQGQYDMCDFLTNDRVRVTAICDVNRRNIEAAKQHIAGAYGKPDVKVYADFRELNADRAIDAVLMTLPVHWHSIPALDAILHGKHIYHEKPMGMSVEESKRVRQAVHAKKMPIALPVSNRHTYNFVEAIQKDTRAICDIDTAVRGDTLCQLALVAVKQGRKLPWDPQVEHFVNDAAADAMLRQRPFRGDWKLPPA